MRGGAAELRVGVGDQQYFRAALHSGDEPSHLEVDLPAFASGDIGPLWLEVIHLDGPPTSLQITQLVVVPRDRAWHEIQPSGGQGIRWMDGGYHSEVLGMRVPESGSTRDTTPVILPEGRAMLRILAGIEYGAPEDQSVFVNIRLRSRDGTWVRDLVENLQIRRGAGSQPSLTGLISIPEDRPPGVLFLDLGVRGDPGSTLHVQALEIVRI